VHCRRDGGGEIERDETEAATRGKGIGREVSRDRDDDDDDDDGPIAHREVEVADVDRRVLVPILRLLA
jgi:hypothetical protein